MYICIYIYIYTYVWVDDSSNPQLNNWSSREWHVSSKRAGPPTAPARQGHRKLSANSSSTRSQLNLNRPKGPCTQIVYTLALK